MSVMIIPEALLLWLLLIWLVVCLGHRGVQDGFLEVLLDSDRRLAAIQLELILFLWLLEAELRVAASSGKVQPLWLTPILLRHLLR